MTQSRSFAGTADLAALWHAWVAPPLFLDRGFYVGRQLGTGRTACFDAQYLRNQGLMPVTNVKIVAKIRGGKTALGKCLADGSMQLQAGEDEQTKRKLKPSVIINDRDLEGSRGEYAKLCDERAGRNVQLAMYGGVNFFVPELCDNFLDIQRIAVEALSDSKHADLDTVELLACQVTVDKMIRSKMPIVPSLFERLSAGATIEDLQAYEKRSTTELEQALDLLITDPEDGYADFLGEASSSAQEREERIAQFRQMYVTPSHITTDPNMQQQFKEACMRISMYMGNLIRGGEYGGMFGDKISAYSLLTDPFTVLDWNGVPTRAANLFEALIFLIISTGLRRGDNAVTPSYMISDEEGSEVSDPRHAAIRAESSRKGRKRKTVDVSQYQYITDLLTVGDAGSALRHWGQVMHRGTGLFLIGEQDDSDEVRDIITKLGVSDLDAWRTTHLPQGHWAAILPGIGIDYIEHIILPSQWDFVLSDKASRDAGLRRPVSADPEVQERLRAIGLLTPGGIT